MNGQLVQRRHLMGMFLGRAVTSDEVSIVWRALRSAVNRLSMEDLRLFVFADAKGEVRLDDGSFSNLIGSDLISLPPEPRGILW